MQIPLPVTCFLAVDFEEALVKSLRVWISTKPWKIRLIWCEFHFGKAIGKRSRGKRRKRSTVDSEFLSLFLRTPFMDKKVLIESFMDYQRCSILTIVFFDIFKRIG